MDASTRRMDAVASQSTHPSGRRASEEQGDAGAALGIDVGIDAAPAEEAAPAAPAAPAEEAEEADAGADAGVEEEAVEGGAGGAGGEAASSALRLLIARARARFACARARWSAVIIRV